MTDAHIHLDITDEQAGYLAICIFHYSVRLLMGGAKASEAEGLVEALTPVIESIATQMGIEFNGEITPNDVERWLHGHG